MLFVTRERVLWAYRRIHHVHFKTIGSISQVYRILIIRSIPDSPLPLRHNAGLQRGASDRARVMCACARAGAPAGDASSSMARCANTFGISRRFCTASNWPRAARISAAASRERLDDVRQRDAGRVRDEPVVDRSDRREPLRRGCEVSALDLHARQDGIRVRV